MRAGKRHTILKAMAASELLANSSTNGRDARYGPALLHQFNVVAVIPVYNEAAHIDGVLRSMPAFVRSIVVVDDHPDAADALAAVLDLLGCPVRVA